MKIRYRIVFDGKVELKNGLKPDEIRDRIAQHFYEQNYDIFDIGHLSWEEIEPCLLQEVTVD